MRSATVLEPLASADRDELVGPLESVLHALLAPERPAAQRQVRRGDAPRSRPCRGSGSRFSTRVQPVQPRCVDELPQPRDRGWEASANESIRPTNAASCSPCHSSCPLAAASSNSSTSRSAVSLQQLLVLAVLREPADQLVEPHHPRVLELGDLVGHERRDRLRPAGRHQDPRVPLASTMQLRRPDGTQPVQVVGHLRRERQRVARPQLRDPAAVLLQGTDLRRAAGGRSRRSRRRRSPGRRRAARGPAPGARRPRPASGSGSAGRPRPASYVR